MINHKHYKIDSGQYPGLFLVEGGGFILAPSSDFDAELLHKHLMAGHPLLTVVSASPRLINGDKLGSRFHFSLAPGLQIKFADVEQIQLIRKLKMDTCTLLSLQLKKSKRFSVNASPNLTVSDIKQLKIDPVIISLSAPKFNNFNADEFWHANASFRISAPLTWLISRQNKLQAA